MATFADAMLAVPALTENGALSYATTHDACVDLFFKLVRNVSGDVLDSLLEKAWVESPVDVVKIIF